MKFRDSIATVLCSVALFCFWNVFTIEDSEAYAPPDIEENAPAAEKQDSGVVAPSPPPAIPYEGIDLNAMELVANEYQQQTEDKRRIVFTMMPELQRSCESIWKKYEVPEGAAVMLSSRTGRVLLFSETLKANRRSPKHSNVVLDATAPAASLFKLVTAAALLDQEKITLDTQTCYRGGSQRLLMEHLADPPKDNRSCVSLNAALGRSINAVFAKLSDRHLTPLTLAQYSERFGFNRDLPFDLPLEKSEASIPEDRLERARTAAGFWHTHLSPLHAAMIAQSLAQRGAMLRPYLVDRVENETGVIYESKPQYMSHTVSEQTAASLAQAMAYTTTRGTARHSFFDSRGVPSLPGITVAGKTGTLMGQKPYRAYTWFVGLAPLEKPEVAFAVLVVNDPSWRIKASGVAVQLLRSYFQNKT